MWAILKHEKDQYVDFIKDITHINEASDELCLHHDYSINAATKNSRQVQQLADYIKTIGNLYKSGDKMINIVTQKGPPPQIKRRSPFMIAFQVAFQVAF